MRNLVGLFFSLAIVSFIVPSVHAAPTSAKLSFAVRESGTKLTILTRLIMNSNARSCRVSIRGALNDAGSATTLSERAIVTFKNFTGRALRAEARNVTPVEPAGDNTTRRVLNLQAAVICRGSNVVLSNAFARPVTCDANRNGTIAEHLSSLKRNIKIVR